MKNWALFREKKEIIPFDVSQAELAWSTVKEMHEIILNLHSTILYLKSAFKLSVKFHLSVTILQQHCIIAKKVSSANIRSMDSRMERKI